jgi:hypothetical protein
MGARNRCPAYELLFEVRNPEKFDHQRALIWLTASLNLSGLRALPHRSPTSYSAE